YGNFNITQNTAVTSQDFTPYCITVPVDARLPGGGGNQSCGFYDVNPTAFGKFDNVISQSVKFGEQHEVYDGIDLTGNARLPRGVIVAGGLNYGRARTDNCFALGDLSLTMAGATTTSTSPRTQPYCEVRPPFLPNVKLVAVYPLPWWGLQTSGTFQS